MCVCREFSKILQYSYFLLNTILLNRVIKLEIHNTISITIVLHKILLTAKTSCCSESPEFVKAIGSCTFYFHFYIKIFSTKMKIRRVISNGLDHVMQDNIPEQHSRGFNYQSDTCVMLLPTVTFKPCKKKYVMKITLLQYFEKLLISAIRFCHQK